MEVSRQMTAAGTGLCVLFDEHAAEYVECGRLKLIRAMPVAAYRVLMLGRRALVPSAAPALSFLRRVACTRVREGLGRGAGEERVTAVW
jgi:hypothetical protein